MHINVEFKARCNQLDRVRFILESLGAYYKGRDHQVDVYFNVQNGRLKLRKGTIENNLIGYEREDTCSSKQSNVRLIKTEPNSSLEEILTCALGVKIVVDKQRDIYFIGNVKFHLDQVQGLGTFVEVEAIDKDGDIGRERLQAQCNHYQELLEVADSDLIAISYSDMFLKKI
ncbi:MAG TPA: class IV adenylate cyclase [Allocoleopsis sp.]